MENPGQDLHSDEQSADHAAKPKPKFMAAEAAAKVGIGKSQSLFTLVLVSFIASLMIAFYVLGVGMFMLHKKQTDTVADAAFEAAHELADISVEHPSTGTLNLCRWRDQGTLFFDSSTDRSRSFESVKRTYDKLQKLAQLTNIAILQDLVGKDRTILGRVEKELRERLDEAIAPELTPHIAASAAAKVEDESLSRGRIYRAVANLIGGRYGLLDKSGLELKIQLGYIKDPARHGDAQMFMIKPELFQPAPENQAPNLVLLSYIEPSKHDSGTSVIKKEASACICINPAYESPAAAALVLNFPQGVPPFALRMADYLKQSSWNNKGIWHQAVDGEVPGAGHLAPPLQPLLPEMSPADALATEMYHWLRYAGDRIDPDTIVAMLQETWSTEPTQVDADHSDEHSFGMMDTQINSCIINDSGSREHALMFEGKEGEAGQSALARAFLLNDSYRSSTPMKPPIPDDAFPLCVDSSGKCTMVGQNRFDEKLIRDFLADLQATNLAARETLSTVKPMQQMSVQVVAQLEQKLRIDREELNSMILRVNKIGSDTKDPKLAMQRRITADKIEDLKMLVDSDATQLNDVKNSQRLCTTAKFNASRAELNTYDLNEQKLRFCREGLTRVEDKGYLLGKNLAFRPLSRALTDTDLEQANNGAGTAGTLSTGSGGTGSAGTTSNATGSTTAAAPSSAKSAWFSNNLILIGAPDEVFPEVSKTIAGKWRVLLEKNAAQTHFAPQMLVIDSRSILEGHKPGLRFIDRFTKYPFSNIVVPQSELIYYCQTAVTTGDKPKVGWSVLARDFLANRGAIRNQSANFTFVGLPIPALNNAWCHGDAFGGTACPRLACEFQVRTPYPLLENSFEQAYLQNAQNGQRSPLIPLVTPDML